MSTRLLMPHRPVRRLGVPVVAAALLAGCGAAAATGGTTSPSSGPSGPCVTSGTQPTPAPTTAGGQGTASTALPLPSPPVPLIVYSAQGYDSTMTKAFTKATGIPVQLDDDSTGPLLAKVQAEKSNPSWDLLWVDGDTAFAALDQQGQLLTYEPAVQLNAAGQSLVPVDHSYVPVSTTIMASVIYNSAAVSAVPTSYADLLGSQYTGKVGMNDPSQSGPTFPFIAGLMNQLGGEFERCGCRRAVPDRAQGERTARVPHQRRHLARPRDWPDRLRDDPELGRNR